MIQNGVYKSYFNDNEIENALKDDIKKKIVKEIKKRCKKIKGVRRITSLIEIEGIDGVYFIEGYVSVKLQKGLVNIDLIMKLVKKEIDGTIEYITNKYFPNIKVQPQYISTYPSL